MPRFCRLRAPLAGLALALLILQPAGADPLQDAVIAGDAKLVGVLLDAGAKADRADLSGLTALHYAAALGKAAVVTALIAAGADPNASDIRGVTPLHLAAAGGHTAAVEALLAAGADPNPGFPVDGRAIRAARQQVQGTVDVNVDASDYDRREPHPPAPPMDRSGADR